MAMLKYGNASLIQPNISVDGWVNNLYNVACSNGKCRMKTAKTVLAKYDPKKYYLSHCTIIAAVDTDLANPKEEKSDYLIKPEYSKFVNNNGDAWSKRLLQACYRTFIGCNNYCFPSGTRVLLSDGTYKNIEEIKVGDTVINRKGEIGTVTNVFKRESSDLMEVNGKGILSRSLFVTKEHPFWVYSARKSCPKTGRPNSFNRDKDFYRLSTWKGFSTGVHEGHGESYPTGIIPGWKNAEDLDVNRDFLTHPISQAEQFNNEVNANRAELIGWFLAEGSYSYTNDSSDEESGITFNLGNDENDVAQKLSLLLIEEFGDKLRIDCQPRIYETQSGSYNLCLSNKYVAEYFKKWCGKYSWAKYMPEEAMWLPKKLQAIILHNCLFGDGTSKISSRGYCIELKSKKLIQQLMWISWRLGILPSYKEVGVLPRYTDISIIDGYEVYTDPISGKRSRPGYSLKFTTRDSKRLCDFSKYDDVNITDKSSNRYTHSLKCDNNEWMISKIKKVQSTDVSCTVYNIEVDNDNSYIVEGVAVHNCEHVQIPELSKGKVIDAVLRDIPIGKDKEGNDLTTYYVDILVATDRKHDDLIRKIEANELNTLSMGCTISYSICSKCGNKAVDETEACQHVRYEKNNLFYDDRGVQRKVAELCGHWSEPDSVKFVDASWVKTPAFVGAVKRSTISVPDDISKKLEAAEKVEGYRKKEGDFLKAAHVVAQDEEDTTEEAPAEETPDDEAPVEEAPPEESPAEENPEFNLDSWKEETKKELMDQIRNEILKELSNEKRPNELETLDDTIIKPASVFKKVWGAKLSWDRFITQSVGNIDKKSFDKLRHGSHIVLTSSDPTVLKDYGYTKRDFLAVLSFIDSHTTNPLTFKIKKAVASMGGTENKSPIQVLARIVELTGEKITKAHGKKVLVWAKMLDSFNC